jgi:hypothetical protein
MKAIQEKHKEAMVALALEADCLRPGTDQHSATVSAIRQATQAFAAAVQHHTDYVTKLKGATKVAREIEDARKKGE